MFIALELKKNKGQIALITKTHIIIKQNYGFCLDIRFVKSFICQYTILLSPKQNIDDSSRSQHRKDNRKENLFDRVVTAFRLIRKSGILNLLLRLFLNLTLGLYLGSVL